MISSVVIFLLFILTVYFVVQPLFIKIVPQLEERKDSVAHLKQRKKILYRQIKELDMDYEIGHIQVSDYTLYRSQLKKEVSEIIDQIYNTS